VALRPRSPPWPRSGGSCATGPAGGPHRDGLRWGPPGRARSWWGPSGASQLQEGHRCGGIQAIGRAERWACDGGGSAASAMATRRSTWRGPRPGRPV